MPIAWLNRWRAADDPRNEAFGRQLLDMEAACKEHASRLATAQSEISSLRAIIDRGERKLLAIEGWIKAFGSKLEEHDDMRNELTRLGNLLRSLEVRLGAEVEELRHNDTALAERLEAQRMSDRAGRPT